jgi:hypothetical protein
MRLIPRDIIATSTEDGAVLLIATKDDGDPQELELKLPFDLAEIAGSRSASYSQGDTPVARGIAPGGLPLDGLLILAVDMIIFPLV